MDLNVGYVEGKGIFLFAMKTLPREYCVTAYAGKLLRSIKNVYSRYIFQLQKGGPYLDGDPDKYGFEQMVKENKLASLCNTCGKGETNNSRFCIYHGSREKTVTIRTSRRIKRFEELLVSYGDKYRLDNRLSITLFLLHITSFV